MRLAALMLLIWPALAWGQSVTLPKEVKGDPGAWVVVVPDKADGGEVKWHVGKGLTRVPIDRLFPGQKAAGVVVQASKPGRYEVWAWNAKGDTASDLAVTTVVIGEAPPTPPDPTPPPVPTDGKRVLILYESGDLQKMPAAQQEILFARVPRDYLNAHCSPDADGKTKAWRIWDKDVDAGGEGKAWQDWLKRERKSVPWLIVSNGRDGYEGPLPGNVDEFLAVCKKHLGD